MRILFISNLYPPATFGGYELVCADVVERLGDRHEVKVITSSRGADASMNGDSRVMRTLRFLEPTSLDSLRAPFASITAARSTRRILAEFRPDLVFVWNGFGIPQAILRLVECSGAMVAYSVAEHWFGQMYLTDKFVSRLVSSDRGLRRVWALLMRGINRLHPALRLRFERPVPVAIVWNSEFMKRETPVPGTVEPVLQCVSYPATRRHALFSQLERRPADASTVLFVGRLERAKGPDIACRALADLRRRHGMDAKLVMAGAATPDQQAGLAALIEQLGIADHVELAGQLAPDELAARLARAHVFVFPSRWEEPFGLVATEAALARVPVVAARSGGIPEALHENEHALFFDREDYAGCADALAATLMHTEATNERVARAYAHASKFTSDRHLGEMEAFVEAAISALSVHRRSLV